MGRRRGEKNQTSWAELILFAMFIFCIYMLLALFNSSLTGEGGRELGKYLRDVWGGAVIVFLLFGIYLSAAKFMKRKVPKIPRQVLGTIQLYISFAFILGLLRETGGSSEMTLLQPGSFGLGLAKFFVLNVGTFIALLLIILSFIFTAYLFGLKILNVELPSIPSLKLRLKFHDKELQEDQPRRNRRRRSSKQIPSTKIESNLQSEEYTPDEIAFMKNIPAPILRDDYNHENYSEPVQDDIIPACSNTIEIIDNILAAINSGELEAPAKKRKTVPPRTRKIRRPLPDLTIPDDEELDKPLSNKSSFPPPVELFGTSAKLELNNDSSKSHDKQGKVIISTLKNFGISASIAKVLTGPSVVQYQLELAPGTKISKLSSLDDEITMALAVFSVRIEAPILGTSYVGVEIPGSERKIITLSNILEAKEFSESKSRLPLPLGVQIDGKVLVQSFDEISHILIAGAKGSGRSMFINSCILSMCSFRKPEELKLIMIDPRHVEFAPYDGLPHLLAAPIFEASEALKALKWVFSEMEKRTSEFARVRVRNLAAYNRRLQKKDRLPEIVIIIDELADLIYSGETEIEGLLLKLSQKSGSAGIHLMLAVQRPSVDVVTTLLKSNISARAAFTLFSESEAKNFGISDAQKLTGKGDMLFTSANFPQAVRLQAPFINEEKIADFVEYLSGSFAHDEYIKF